MSAAEVEIDVTATIPSVDPIDFDKGFKFATDLTAEDIDDHDPETVGQVLSWIIEDLSDHTNVEGVVEVLDTPVSPSFVYGAMVAVVKAFEGRGNV